jgi:hypothetical protein
MDKIWVVPSMTEKTASSAGYTNVSYNGRGSECQTLESTHRGECGRVGSSDRQRLARPKSPVRTGTKI